MAIIALSVAAVGCSVIAAFVARRRRRPRDVHPPGVPTATPAADRQSPPEPTPAPD